MSCARASAALAEPVAATAAVARTWLLIEQAGPWGAKALKSSHLDPEVGRALERLADGTGVRVALIRRTGRHADLHRPARRRVIIAHTAPDDPWIRTASLADPAELTALDFAALGAGSHGGFGTAYDGPPIALVCTNGRRDQCCAVYGRPLADELTRSGGHDVWEVTHLGGHRFAPTMLVLPHGYAYGRVNGHHAKDILEAAASGLVVLAGCRGRSAWERPGQAAELAVRSLTGEERADALAVGPAEPRGGDHWTVPVTHRDGRVWEVAVTRSAAQPPRPESCGAALGTPARLDVTSVEQVAGAA
ncbi:sucrase ferredoxin [Streptomyces sp. PLK6-54]|uniref:Sucrase ferredoxin n=1 Tax=Actinacidiphila acidipaludis TaxID=2873382 RepID=A0ABS7Q6B9_9ACTN|nr:sucrase ferredoxin [Streptomyces acidipaludis]